MGVYISKWVCIFQSVQECVQHYYLSKKNENYKQLLRKQTVKKRKFQRVQTQSIRPDDKDDKPVVEGEPEEQSAIRIITTLYVSFRVWG